MKSFVSVTENFLDEEMFSTLKTFAETTTLYDLNVNNTIWNQRIVHATQAPEIRDIGRQYIKIVTNKIKSDFELDKQIFTDILCFNRWRVGDMQHPHADDENGFEWRKFGCVLYLNDDYEGGNIYFPTQSLSIKPKANTLAFFPGNREFLHGVEAVTSGIRYTLSTFWTYDFSRAISL